ncbi:MAG: hypothetical protein AB7S81_03185 [Bdellovibrionales bacterium]
MSSELPKNGPSFRAGFFLTFFLLLCIGMTCAAGYIKMKLDQAELELAAPQKTTTIEEKLYEKTVMQLGYGGFLGSAQAYMAKLKKDDLATMRKQYETARNAAMQAAKMAPTSVKNDIEGILSVYRNILVRAETGGDALSSGITQSDLVIATDAMATLNARLQTLQAQSRMTAHAAFKKWSLALMFLTWGAVLVATSLTFWAFSAQDKQLKAPLKALAQSVANITKIDMEKPIWGLERDDEVGDLAREIDMARRYFSQVPDISINSENGTTRLKFDGEAGSLFKTMMKNVTQHFEEARERTNAFTSKFALYQDTIETMKGKIQNILDEISKHGETSEATIKRLAHALEDASTILSSAQTKGVMELKGATEKLVSAHELSAQKIDNIAYSLVTTQEKNARQLDQIIPSMQERLHNMAQITQLAGTQITQSLTSLQKAEQTLQATSSYGQSTIKQLASATSQMGDRMFAALNLMKASGKQFSETNEVAQTKISKVMESLTRGESNLTSMLERAEKRLNNTINAEKKLDQLASRTETSADKMSEVVESIAQQHEILDEQVATATHRMSSIVASFETAQHSLADATNKISRDSSLVGNLLQELRKNNDSLLSALSQNSQTGFASVQNLTEKSHALMQRLELQIQTQSETADTHLSHLNNYSQSMLQQATSTNNALKQAVGSLNEEQNKLAQTRKGFSQTMSDVGLRLEEHATKTFGKTEEWASKSFVRMGDIADQVESVMQRLNILSQLTGTLGTVAGQLGQVVPVLTNMGGRGAVSMQTTPPIMSAEMPPVIIDLDDAKKHMSAQAREIIETIHSQWNEASLQMETMRDALADVIIQQKDQLETRLIVLDKKLKDANDVLSEAPIDGATRDKHTAVINELVHAISKINEHVIELDEAVGISDNSRTADDRKVS